MKIKRYFTPSHSLYGNKKENDISINVYFACLCVWLFYAMFKIWAYKPWNKKKVSCLIRQQWTKCLRTFVYVLRKHLLMFQIFKKSMHTYSRPVLFPIDKRLLKLSVLSHYIVFYNISGGRNNSDYSEGILLVANGKWTRIWDLLREICLQWPCIFL